MDSLLRCELRCISNLLLLLRVSSKLLIIFWLESTECLDDVNDMMTDRLRLALNLSTSACVCNTSVYMGCSILASFLSVRTSCRYLVLAS